MNFAGAILLLIALLSDRLPFARGFGYESAEITPTDCSEWRLNVEANNIRHWKVVPEECIEHVKYYMLEGEYEREMAAVAEKAVMYAKEFGPTADDGMDAWVLDIDDTALSNLEYYKANRFGGQVFDQTAFNKWVLSGKPPTLMATLRLYEELTTLGFKIFFITGRDESQREITRDNLVSQGYTKWAGLILRGESDQGQSAVVYKSRKREELVKDGYRIRGNGGDQWSDITGNFVGDWVFKLPNPMYFIS